MKEIKFGNITISEDKPAVIIAEAACEHRGNMPAAKRLIDAAKEAGADIIKFQLHVPDEEMVTNSIKFWAGSMDDILEEVNFGTLKQHLELKEYCKKKHIQYLCTPFCIKAADILEEVGVDAYKIGSGESTNLPMLRHVARKGKPIIASIGMSTPEEIADVVAVLKDENSDFILTHCVSEYPTSYQNMNLKLIREYREKFSVMVGLSDHSNEMYSALAAVVLGAKLIEKHFTIRDLHGADDIVSLDPLQFKEMVKAIRKIEKALSDTKGMSSGELEVRNWAKHSVVTAVDIKEGDKLTSENLVAKRPGSGIESKYLDQLYSKKLLNKKAKRNLTKNTVLKWEDIE